MIDAGEDPVQKKAEQKAELTREKLLVKDVWKAFLKYHKRQWSDVHYNDTLYYSRAATDTKEAGILWPLMEKRMIDIDAAALVQWAETATREHKNKFKAVQTQRKINLQEAERLERSAKRASAKGNNRQAEKDLKEAAKLRTQKLSNIKGNNTALRQGYKRFRAFWNWAVQREEYRGLNSSAMFQHSDLTRLLPPMKPKSDSLEKAQLKSWFEAVQKIENPQISAYLQILLLTGARRNELAALKWEDVDFKWKSIWIKDKVEDKRQIPLTPYVEFLLSRLPDSDTWVFSSPTSKKTGHITEPRLAHKRALLVAGLPDDLSLHGLRRSFSTLSEWLEMPVGIVAQIMGHKPSATAEKHYKRRPLELLAKSHTTFENWILEQAEIQFNAKAVKEGLHVAEE
ncbi:MAG: tyrosine-type recombinase/integrase [Deltaproteobacteria bacterium]|nr:tyrosine-type recombinase/integrase [Deltaproteobacteria bacterium]